MGDLVWVNVRIFFPKPLVIDFFPLTRKANCMAAISLKSVSRIIFSEIIHSLRSQMVGP